MGSVLQETDLYDYQQHMADWVFENPRCALWVDMGLGKTVGTLTALVRLINQFYVGQVLVIAPLRVARKTWSDEIEKWAHTQGLTVSKIVGNAKQRTRAMYAEADIYTINRENVEWLVAHFARDGKLIQRWPWDTVVLDESRSFHNRSTNRWKAIRRVLKYIDRLVELTGTPSPQGLMDLWGQVYLLDQGQRLGKTLTAFRQRWFDPPGYNQYKWKPKPHAEQEIKELLADICLTLREEDYLELPPVTYNYIPAFLTDGQRQQYQTLERKAVVEVNDKTITAVNAGALAGKLLQLANGAVYHSAPDWEFFHDGKIEVLMEILEQTQGPVMVCYNFKSDLARLESALTKAKVNWDRLTDTDSEVRWNNGATDVLLLHPASAGHGLNLHESGAETLVWFGLNWSVELYQQANARLIGGHRRKDRNVVIHHIVTEGTIDDDVRWALKAKADSQDRLMDAMKRRVRSAKLGKV